MKLLSFLVMSILHVMLVLILLVPAQAEIKDGLQGYYGMENYTDYMGNYPDFVLTDGAVQVNDSHCIIDGCVDFDGTSLLNFQTEVTNYTEMTINMFLHWHDATRDWSWMKTTFDAGLDMIVIEQYSDPGDIEFRYYFDNAWQFDAGYETDFTSNEAEEQDMFTIRQRDMGTYYEVNIFYEGLKAGSGNISTGNPLNNGWTDYIGVASTDGISNRGFNGDVDEFAVFNRALSDAEILRMWEIYESGQTVFNYSDPNPPTCINWDNVSFTNFITYNWSVQCTDEFIFSFNLECSDGYNYSTSSINNENYNFSESNLFTANATCDAQICDGHTNEKLKELEEEKIDDKTYKFKIKNQEAQINIDEQNDALLTVQKQYDRYKFKITNLDKTKENKIKDYTFYYSTPDGKYIDKDEKYQSWIIDESLNTWFDLESEQQIESINMFKIDGDTWQFDIETYEEELVFNSIGELNCLNVTTVFTDLATTQVNDTNTTNTTTTTGATTSTTNRYTILFLFAIWIVLFAFTIIIKGDNGGTIQLLNGLQLAIGVTIGYQMLSIFPLIGLTQIISSVTGFFYLVVK